MKLRLVISQLFLSILLWCPAIFAGEMRLNYVGFNSSEARLTFSHWVDWPFTSAPSEEEAGERVEQQLRHLFGPLSYDTAAVKAVPKSDHRIFNINVREMRKSQYRIYYDYQGTIAVEASKSRTLELILPNNPDEVYSAGFVDKTNFCTDSHYTSEGDFWYFWSPDRYNCPLQEGRDYQRIRGNLVRIANTQQTYPEYDRLIGPDQKIRMDVLFGMDDPGKGRNPLTSSDINATNYRDLRQSLLQLGYTVRTWASDEIFAITPLQKTPPYVEEFTKWTPAAPLVVRMFFGPSDIGGDSRPFHYFLKDAFDHAGVLIYDGHSGLGGHLNLRAIERLQGISMAMNKDRYQIFFINSCTSYTYYNNTYFLRKRSPQDPSGTKNLDLLANALPTSFFSIPNSSLALIRAVDDWATGRATQSYQELVRLMDSGNLFGVNGDEDNPTTN